MNGRFWIFLAALLGSVAVAAGAVGAHALGNAVSVETKAIFRTGQQYHVLHALALLAVGIVLLQSEGRRARFSTWSLQAAALAFLIGILCFSGGIYVQVAEGFSSSAGIVPLGGLSFMIGWAAFAIAALAAQLKEEATPALRRENKRCNRLFSYAGSVRRHQLVALGLAAAAFGLHGLGLSFGLFGASALRFGLFARRAIGAFRGGRSLAVRLADAVNFADSDSQESAKIVRRGRVEPGGNIQSICEAVCNRIDRDCGRGKVRHFNLLSMKMALSAKFTDSNCIVEVGLSSNSQLKQCI